MRDTKSMILGNDGVDKIKTPPAPISQKEETKPVASDAKPVDPLPTSSNGYAQAAAQVNVVNDAIQGKVPSTKTEEQEIAPVSAPVKLEHPKIESLTDFTNEIYRSRVPSDQELAKEGKREKARAVIAAIADGASAISNLYFTGKGANNVEQTSMSAANSKRYQAILDRRMKRQGEWDNARLAAYDRDRVFEHQLNRDKKVNERHIDEWNRSAQWHDDAVAREDAIRREERDRRDRTEKETKAIKEREFDAQEKARKDASARGWAVVGAQNKRAEAQERKQKEQSKYHFGKLNGSPEPKMINHTQSIYIGKNVWEQNAGQIAGEILRDLRSDDEESAKKFERTMQGGITGKGISAKDMAALVDKYIMDSPSAQKLAVELEKDYKKRYELAANGSLSQDESDDLGFTPLPAGSGSSVDVDSLFD